MDLTIEQQAARLESLEELQRMADDRRLEALEELEEVLAGPCDCGDLEADAQLEAPFCKWAGDQRCSEDMAQPIPF